MTDNPLTYEEDVLEKERAEKAAYMRAYRARKKAEEPAFTDRQVETIRQIARKEVEALQPTRLPSGLLVSKRPEKEEDDIPY